MQDAVAEAFGLADAVPLSHAELTAAPGSLQDQYTIGAKTSTNGASQIQTDHYSRAGSPEASPRPARRPTRDSRSRRPGAGGTPWASRPKGGDALEGGNALDRSSGSGGRRRIAVMHPSIRNATY